MDFRTYQRRVKANPLWPIVVNLKTATKVFDGLVGTLVGGDKKYAVVELHAYLGTKLSIPWEAIEVPLDQPRF